MTDRVAGRRPFAVVAMPWMVALIAVLVYANALGNGFVLDDEGVILNNPLVHGVDGTWRAFAHPYWPTHAGQYRPLVIATYAADWSIWGNRPLAFHAVNIVWHALASVLVYFLGRRWLSFGGAAMAALLFAVHPVHVEAVANVVGRAELIAACGVLATLILHERRSAWAALAFAVALFSKEHAIVAPALALLCDAARRRSGAVSGQPRSAELSGSTVRVNALYLLYAAVAVVWTVAAFAALRNQPLAVVDPAWQALDAPARWLTMLGVVPTWGRLWFAPFNLSADYSPRVIELWPSNAGAIVLGALLLSGSAIAAVVAWRRARYVSLAIAWLLVAVAPVANVLVPTGVIVAERTLYLSSVGAMLLIGAGLERVGRRSPFVAVVLFCAVGAAYAGRVWTRTPVWHSNRSVLLATAASHPEASATRMLLARVHARTGDYTSALDAYRASLTLFEKNDVAWADAIELASRSGDAALADSLWREAVQRARPSYFIIMARSGAALRSLRYTDALSAARHAAVLEPDSARAPLFEVMAWMGLGERDSAHAARGRISPVSEFRAAADSLLGQMDGRPGR